MNVDALVLALLAMADLSLLIYMRRVRARYLRSERIIRSLRLHIRTLNAPVSVRNPMTRSLRVS